MKIRALRVREVGIFRQAAALEGLSGGLDVLAGPNELGKSTLYRALTAAFTAEHKTTRADLKRLLVPNTGGAPTIEVDFELAGANYRLRKRYFTAAKASLTSLLDGVLLRGADAEARLAELLAIAGGLERLGLLWVEQSGSLSDFEIGETAAAGLHGLVERQLAFAAGGGHAQAIRRKIRARLDELVTGGRRQPRGIYKDMLDREARLRHERDHLAQKFASNKSSLDRLAVLRQSHEPLVSTVDATRRAEAIAAARAALETARAGADKRRAAEEAWKRHDQSRAAAAAALANFDSRIKDASVLELQSSTASAALTDIAAKHDIARERHQTAANDLAALEAAERVIAVRLASNVAALRQSVAANLATPDLARAAEAEANTTATLEARLAASSVHVSVVYDIGADGKITSGGVPVAAVQAIAEPIELQIAGIGRIQIAPTGDAAAIKRDLEASRARLLGLLTRGGAASLEALRALSVRRGETATALDRTTRQLETICPEGIEALQADIDWQPTGEDANLANPAGLDAELKALQSRRKAAVQAQAAALAGSRQHELALARLETEAAALVQRHLALSASLPPADEARIHRETLVVEAGSAAGRAGEAVALLDVLRQREPDSAKLSSLDADLASAIAADADITAKTNAQAQEMAALDAELRRDAADGIGERLAECESELALAERAVMVLRTEVDALALLDEEFARAEAGSRAQYLGPVLDRITPYLQMVLPGAEMTMGEAYRPQSLQRQNRAEPASQLSLGTREQVAVLVRLGLARLLADTGEPLPMILDDALAYADDQRIAASFAGLQQAARHHQVIVLTCREKSFAALGGTQLALQPWAGFAE